MIDAAAARHLRSRLEVCHAFVCFAPEPVLNYADLGLGGGAATSPPLAAEGYLEPDGSVFG